MNESGSLRGTELVHGFLALSMDGVLNTVVGKSEEEEERDEKK